MNGFFQDEQGNHSISRLVPACAFGSVLIVWALVSLFRFQLQDIPAGVVQIVYAAGAIYAGVKAVSLGIGNEKKEG